MFRNIPNADISEQLLSKMQAFCKHTLTEFFFFCHFKKFFCSMKGISAERGPVYSNIKREMG